MNSPRAYCDEQSGDQRPLIVVLLLSTPWWVVSAVIHMLLCAVVAVAAIDVTAESPDNTLTIPLITPLSENDIVREKQVSDQIVPSDVVIAESDLKQLSAYFSARPDDVGNGIIEEDTYGDSTLGVGNVDGYGDPVGGSASNRSIISSCCRSIICKRKCSSSANNALAWLAKHQEPDGHWDARKFGASSKTDVAVTALALLAFTAEGHTERAGAHRKCVAMAIDWLLARPPTDIQFNEAGDYRGGYPQAIVAFALCEQAQRITFPRTRSAAQRAVDACIAAQNDDGGWRYGRKQGSDLSVSGWYIMALHSAAMAHLQVSDEALDKARKFIGTLEVCDYSDSYTPPSHFIYQIGNEKPESRYRLSAIGTLARLYLGQWPKQALSSYDAFIAGGGLPEWGASGEKVDLYYWYYASLCDNTLHATARSAWQRQIVAILKSNQCKRDDDAGSWPAVGVYADEWGRVGETSLACLCLALNDRGEPTEKE
jgi:hypothetical protein